MVEDHEVVMVEDRFVGDDEVVVVSGLSSRR